MKKKVKCLLVLLLFVVGTTNVQARITAQDGGRGSSTNTSSNTCFTLDRIGAAQYMKVPNSNKSVFISEPVLKGEGISVTCMDHNKIANAGLQLVDGGQKYNPRAARALKCQSAVDSQVYQAYAWGMSKTECTNLVAAKGVIKKTALSLCKKGYSFCDSAKPSTNYVQNLVAANGSNEYQPFAAPLGTTGDDCKDLSYQCLIVGGVYYGISGTPVSFSQYMQECPHYCKYINGVYYGSSGTVVSQSQFFEECPVICTQIGGTYYGKSGKIVSYEKFKEECPEPDEEIPVQCPPPSGTGGTCENSGHYYDLNEPGGNENQFLVLKQCDTGKEIYASPEQISANYCKAYCVEDLYSSFPSSSPSFQAGQYYSIGDSGTGNVWGPISFSGSRQCRSFKDNGKTEGVNTEQLIADYNAAASAEITAYNNWQNNIRHNEAANTAPAYPRNKEHCSETTDLICDVGYEKGGRCVTEGEGYYDPSCVNGCGSQNYDCIINSCWVGGTTQDHGEAYCPDGYYKEGGHCRENEDRWGTWYEPKAYTAYNNYGSASTKYTAGQCDDRDTVDEGSGAYYSARNRRLALENIARGCNEFSGFNYNLNPTVNVSASFDSNYSFSNDLAPSETLVTYTTNGQAQPGINGSGSNENPAYCAGDTCQMVHYECSGDHCTYSGNKTAGETMAGLNVDQKIVTIQKYIYYSLQSVPYQFVSKVDGGVLAGPNGYSGNFIDLGGKVVPISTSLAPGRYNVDFSYSGVGHNNHFEQYVQPSPFQCGIRIQNDIECYECDPNGGGNTPGGGNEPNGLDVIYRTIKLGDQKTAFPSIDGDGREPGQNWYSHSENLVAKYITNNRNVKGEAVYSLEPLYSITLTPQRIKEIRAFNRNTEYGDFNLKCTEAKNCISDFIHNTVTVGGRSYDFARYFREAPGTCQNISAAGSNFNSCADK